MKKTILSLAAFLGLTLGLNAQLWIQEGAGFTAASRGFLNIFAVNSQVVWAAAYDGTNVLNPCQDFTVTTNGGTTWHPKVCSAAANLCFSMICPVDSLTAWVATFSPTGTLVPGVYKTIDGGNTWTHQTTGYTTASFPDIIYFWDANTGVTMGDPVGGKFEIYTTSNGGTTWTVVPGANIPVPTGGETAYTTDLSVVGNTIWFGTSRGRVYKSIDQGHNWTVAVPAGMTGKSTWPSFQDANNGFCMKFISSTDTSNLLDISSDGGTSYTHFTYAGSVYNSSMEYVKGTPNTYVSVGADATNQPTRVGFTYSTDGGNTWYVDPQMNGTQLTATEWLNDSTGWAGTFTTDATDGLFKFNNVLALKSDFMTNDTSIIVLDSAHFQNLSLGRITSYLWTFQNGNPSTSTLKTPPPVYWLQNGSWNVTLKVTGDLGSRTLTKTGYIHVGGLGINEHSKSSISVYPNPVKDYMNIKASARMQEIQVINIIGQVILNQKVNNTIVTLNSTELKPGIYNLKVKMEDGYIYQKIVVN